jgi:hypothetical protein
MHAAACLSSGGHDFRLVRTGDARRPWLHAARHCMGRHAKTNSNSNDACETCLGRGVVAHAARGIRIQGGGQPARRLRLQPRKPPQAGQPPARAPPVEEPDAADVDVDATAGAVAWEAEAGGGEEAVITGEEDDGLAERQGSGAEASSSGSPSGGVSLSRRYSYLFTKRAATISDASVRTRYRGLLVATAPLLHEYDIRSGGGRVPNIRKNPAVIEPSLTLRAAALLEARRRPRLSAAAPKSRGEALPTQEQRVGGSSAAGEQPGADGAWEAKQARQASYLVYIRSVAQQLGEQGEAAAGVVAALAPIDGEGADAAAQVHADVDAQLLYQVGITDDWVQCTHLVDAFGGGGGGVGGSGIVSGSGGGSGSGSGSGLRASPAAALLRQLGALLGDPRARERMSPLEVCQGCVMRHTIHTAYAIRHTAISSGFPHRMSPV